MAEILGAIEHPLSICGLALLLVFRLLKKRMLGQHRSLYPLAMAMAVIALVGGLALTFWDIANRAPTPPKTKPAATQTPASSKTPQPSVRQTSEGEQSPNIANTEGDVNITFGASEKKKETPSKK